MSVKSYAFRQGEPELLKLQVLSKKSSLDTLMHSIISDEDTKEIADLNKIDGATLQMLRDCINILVDNRHQFHFAPDSKARLKNYEANEMVNIETVQKFLDEELSSFAIIIEADMTENAAEKESKVSKEDHKYNVEIFEEMYHILARLYHFVTNTECLGHLPDDISTAIKTHCEDLLEMKNTFCNLPFEGKLKKGRYPSCKNVQLCQMRHRRDKWMEYYSSIVMIHLGNRYSKKDTKKRTSFDL